ncbi:MAG: hypothetical protein RL557_617 [archaeon]|jgi:uncharacterized membrane protein YheB (UPF0754 family)
MELNFFLIPIIGFIIGYVTNWIAIVMLFHPRQKILGMQGVIPKRKLLLAKKISEITPEIMPPYFKQLEKIPLIGRKIIEAFKQSVETQIHSLSDEQLEQMTYKVLKQEFFFIEFIGGILGFLIGLIQLGIAVWM